MPRRRISLGLGTPLITVIAAISVAGSSGAEPPSGPVDAVIAARTASGCAPMELDPFAERAALMANQGTIDYIAFRSAAVPFSDPMAALTTMGYTGGGRAMLLSGYGAEPGAAVRALQLQWQVLKPDCSYTRFGTSTLHAEAGFDVVAAVLLAPDPPRR